MERTNLDSTMSKIYSRGDNIVEPKIIQEYIDELNLSPDYQRSLLRFPPHILL